MAHVYLAQLLEFERRRGRCRRRTRRGRRGAPGRHRLPGLAALAVLGRPGAWRHAPSKLNNGFQGPLAPGECRAKPWRGPGQSPIGTKIFLDSARAGGIRSGDAANISCDDGSVSGLAGAPAGRAGRGRARARDQGVSAAARGALGGGSVAAGAGLGGQRLVAAASGGVGRRAGHCAADRRGADPAPAWRGWVFAGAGRALAVPGCAAAVLAWPGGADCRQHQPEQTGEQGDRLAGPRRLRSGTGRFFASGAHRRPWRGGARPRRGGGGRVADRRSRLCQRAGQATFSLGRRGRARSDRADALEHHPAGRRHRPAVRPDRLAAHAAGRARGARDRRVRAIWPASETNRNPPGGAAQIAAGHCRDTQTSPPAGQPQAGPDRPA